MNFISLRPPTLSRFPRFTPALALAALIALGVMLPSAKAISYIFNPGSFQVSSVAGPTPTPATALLKQIPATLVPTGTNGIVLNLNNYFVAPSAPTNIVEVNSSMGNFCIELFPINAPVTVANFLDYVNDSAYTNMMVHRSVPGFIIQTGGFSINPSSTDSNYFPPIATFPAITNEFGLSNLRGTVAMALVGTNPNSGNSQWFINLTNNSSQLDATNTVGNPPFTVFGQVIGNGMSIVDAIAALPTTSLTSYGGALTDVPLQGWNGQGIAFNNIVTITNVLTLPYAIANSDSSAFSATIQGTNLVIKYLGTKNTPPLTAPVTLTAYAADTNGNTVQSTFQVSERKLYPYTQFPANFVTFNKTNAPNYVLTNLPFSSSGLPVTISIAGGPAKNFRIVTNQVVQNTTNAVVTNSVTNGVTNTITNNVVTSTTNIFTNDMLTLTGAGNVSLLAHQPGNAIYAPSSEYGYVVVYKSLQTITFNRITNQTPSLSPSSPTAPILPWNPPTASSGLPVSIVVKSGPAKANKNTNSLSIPFDLTGSGTVTLVATQNGNAGYYAARPVTNVFTVTALGGSTNSIKPVKKN